MIISNQIEYLKYLYEQLKYDEVIQLSTITLPMTLEEKRYHEALYCYEYMASSYFEVGKFMVIRSYMGMLFYYATTKQEESFLNAKQEFINLMNNSMDYYRANLELVDAFLGLYHGNQEGVMHLERVYTYYYKQASIIHLNIVKYCVEHFQLGSRFSYYEDLNTFLLEAETKPAPMKNIRSNGSEFFFVDELPAVSVKYPNVTSLAVIEQHVEQAFRNNVDMYCLHWSLGIEHLEDLFGQLFLDQLLFTLFETIYKSIFDYESEVIVRTKNEGEAIIQHISEEEFFQLLMKLEEKLQSVIVHSTSGNVEMPIHFGFIHSSQLPDEERHYAGLTAHADASLYYAKSRGQFYIYS